MQLFLSTHISRIDDKRRVSIPTQFRAVLNANQSNDIVYAYASFINKCIVLCAEEQLLWIEHYLEKLEHFSSERDIILTAVLSACEQLQIDAKGRVMLSESLLKFAEIEKEIVFVGKGKSFEIWNKDQFFTYYNNARTIAPTLLNSERNKIKEG